MTGRPLFEVPIIEEFMRNASTTVVSTTIEMQLTPWRKFKGAHSEPLFTLLRTGMYTLKGEKIRVG